MKRSVLITIIEDGQVTPQLSRLSDPINSVPGDNRGGIGSPPSMKLHLVLSITP